MDRTRYQLAESRLWASLGVETADRTIDLAQADCTIRVQDVGAGPPIVFLHGGAISGTCWAPLVAALPDFRCIVVDRPGCGLSEPLPTSLLDIEALAAFADRFVVDVLDGLELDSAHLVATSFGGYTALRATAASPERVLRVVEMGFPVGAPTGAAPLSMRLMSVPIMSKLLLAIPPNETMVRAMLKNIGLAQALKAGRITSEMIDWLLSLLRDTDTMRNELRTNPPIVLPLKGLNTELLLSDALLGSIRRPSAFLWGSEDPFGGDESARAFVQRIPDAELEVVPGAGHAVWMDDPEHAAQFVRSFLTRSP